MYKKKLLKDKIEVIGWLGVFFAPQLTKQWGRHSASRANRAILSLIPARVKPRQTAARFTVYKLSQRCQFQIFTLLAAFFSLYFPIVQASAF